MPLVSYVRVASVAVDLRPVDCLIALEVLQYRICAECELRYDCPHASAITEYENDDWQREIERECTDD